MRGDTLALRPGLHWEAVSELAGYGEQLDHTGLAWLQAGDKNLC